MKSSFASQFSGAMGLLLAGAAVLHADPLLDLQLNIEPPGISNEFVATPALSWDAEAGVSYTVQVSTNLADPDAWNDVEVAAKSTAGPLKWMSPETIKDQRFYRLVTRPAIYDVQPALVNSDDTNAYLYIVGQLLPGNSIVVINGQNFALEKIGEGDFGVVYRVSLIGLPPDTAIAGTISVLDADTSDEVATYKLESGFIYATQPSSEMLQGPPDEPPASPPASAFRSKKSYDYYQAASDSAAARAGNSGVELPNVPNSGVGTPAYIFGHDPDEDCDDISDASGEFRCRQTDLAIPGACLDFAWTRTYRSRTGSTTAQGAGWDFSYNVSLTQNGDGTITLHPGNGRADTFYPDGTNGWFRDEYFCQIIDLNADGMPDVLFADTSRWLFNPLATGGAAGKLAQVIDRNGNTISLNYDGKGRLTEIVDDLGRTNTLAYNSSGKIESVTDFSGRAVRYEYDTDGNLAACISPPTSDFPGGITNRYTYTSGNSDDRLNHNLQTCVDGKGQTWLQINYQATSDPASIDFDCVDNVQTFSSGGVLCSTSHLRRFSQTPSPTNNFAVIKAIRHDGVGNVTESFYDSRGRCVRELDYTGRCDPNSPVTESVNRPTGKLRAEDPDYFETDWTWNADSLCANETLPDGEIMEYTYQRAFNQNASRSNHSSLIDGHLHNGDLRVLRVLASPGSGGDLDGDGVPDISELSWHFDYDPRFGSPVSLGRSRYHGWDGTIKGRLVIPEGNGVAIKSKGTGADKNRTAGGLNPALPLPGQPWTGPELDNPADSSQADIAVPWIGNSPSVPHNGAVPHSFGHAINTKGAGTNGRVAIKSKGTGADKNRASNYMNNPMKSPRMSISDCDDNDPNRHHPTLALADLDADGALDFVVSTTDPRGQTTEANYDASGNRVLLQHQGRLLDGNDAPVENFGYNSRGQLVAVTNAPDANGYRRVDTIEYYSNGSQSGWPQSIAIDEDGVHLTSAFEYDATGNLTRYVDSRTNDWLFAYDSLDQCVSVQSPVNVASRHAITYSYDACGNVQDAIEELRDENDSFVRNVTTHYSYDALDRLTGTAEQVSAGVFVTNRFTYDANDQLTLAESPLAVNGEDPHNVTAFEYDERGLLFRQISAPGSGMDSTNRFNYTLNGAVASRWDQDPYSEDALRTFNWSYDGFSRPVNFTDPMGNVTRYAYDRNGNLTLVRCYGETNDVDGSAGNIVLAQTQYAYDSLDRCTQTRDIFNDPVTQSPFGKGVAVTTYVYAPNDECTGVTDDNGHTTSYSYDTAGRLAATVSPGRKAMLQWYLDSVGNVISEVISNQPDGGGAAQLFARGFSYDSQNRCVAAWDNVGNTNRYEYDSLGRVTSQTDPNGVLSTIEYDDLGRGLKLWVDKNGDGMMDPGELDRASAFDANSQLVSATDANTNTTSYAYDSLGNVIHVMNGDGTVINLIWSPRSNLISEEDANGTTVTNIYDQCDRVIHRDIAARNAAASTTTFEDFGYDGMSRCVSAANDSSTNTFSYDSMGDCIRSLQDGYATAYTYDGVGNYLSITYPSTRIVSYTYDADDNVSSISTDMGGGSSSLATFAYAGPGRLAQISRANGIDTLFQWDGKTGQANAAGDYGWGQISSISHQSSGGAVVLDRRACTYDRNQNRTSRTQTVPFVQGQDATTNVWSYDSQNHLVAGTIFRGNSVASKLYKLDANGNRLTVTNNGVAEDYFMDDTLPVPGDFQMNQYTTTPFGSQVYDENGNLTARGSGAATYQYIYDYADRLVQVTNLFSGTLLASYSYDALGRRICKTIFADGLPPATTEYILGEPGEVCDDGDTDEILETYSDAALIDSYVHKLDDGLTVYRASNGGTSAYYLNDDLGSALALADDSGNILERYDYDDFGQPSFLSSDGSAEVDGGGLPATESSAGNPFLFRGMEWDAKTSFYFSGNTTGTFDPTKWQKLAGYYAPETGQTISRNQPVRCPDGSCRTAFDSNPWSSSGACSAKTRDYLYEKFQNGDIPNQDREICPGGLRTWSQPDDAVAMVSRNVLKTYFEKGDVPGAEQRRVEKFHVRQEFGPQQATKKN